MNYTHAFTPTCWQRFRAGFARFYLNEYQNDSSLETNNKVGIPNINQGTRSQAGLSP